MNKFIFILLIGTLYSCVHKNIRDYNKTEDQKGVDEVYIEPKVSFSKQINPIFQTHCIGCHRPGSTDPNARGDYFFNDYNGIKKKIDEKYSGETQSKIQSRIKNPDPNQRMPFLLPALSQEEIKLIDAWVAQGAANN